MDKKVILKPKEDNASTFSIRVDRDLIKKYDHLSQISNRSRNELINLAMKHYIEVVEFVPDVSDNEDESKEFKPTNKLKKKIPINKDK